MKNTDLAYYRGRHAEEVRAAAETANPHAAASHAKLAELYVALLADDTPLAAE